MAKGKDVQNGDPRPAAPTLDEVARMARVSRATVSRVVNDSPLVTPATRKSVEKAIGRLGYVPNRAARSLVTRRTDTIALVLSEPEDRVFSDPFFRSILRGVTEAIEDTDLQLVLLFAQSGRDREKVERYLRQGHVDGVILMSLHGSDPLPTALTAARIPTVLSGRPRPGERLPFVDADNRGGARLATEHLLSSGRRALATVTGPMDMTAAVDRLEGYREAAEEARAFRKSLVAEGDFTERGGAAAMRALLRGRSRIDGVFVASDPMAIGALRVLEEAGLRVPEDVAVVGFDDAPGAEATAPPLTTVRQPLDAMARAMTELLLRRIDGLAGDDDAVVCPTELVVRAST
jgi:DNA-binding LacI/PurR family transcriptional regulator